MLLLSCTCTRYMCTCTWCLAKADHFKRMKYKYCTDTSNLFVNHLNCRLDGYKPQEHDDNMTEASQNLTEESFTSQDQLHGGLYLVIISSFSSVSNL